MFDIFERLLFVYPQSSPQLSLFLAVSPVAFYYHLCSQFSIYCTSSSSPFNVFCLQFVLYFCRFLNFLFASLSSNGTLILILLFFNHFFRSAVWQGWCQNNVGTASSAFLLARKGNRLARTCIINMRHSRFRLEWPFCLFLFYIYFSTCLLKFDC